METISTTTTAPSPLPLCPHGDDEHKTIRMMKNTDSALCSRARKRIYMYLTC
jgi:hypothetical protein